MVLLRRLIGDALRARRQAQHRTLREVSTSANVSLGYLSEIERGQKEASSELLSSICDALGAQLSEVLRDVSDTMALAEQMEEALAPVNEQSVASAPAESAAGCRWRCATRVRSRPRCGPPAPSATRTTAISSTPDRSLASTCHTGVPCGRLTPASAGAGWCRLGSRGGDFRGVRHLDPAA